MKTGIVQDTHRLAMALGDYAARARRYGDINVATELLQRALFYESRAAELMDDDPDVLWRAVLYRSAASLALQCGEYEEAKRLIATGLAGNPPSEIAAELRDVLKLVKQAQKQEQKGGEKDTLPTEIRQHTA